ncbi:FAD-binding oxidoreductase [Afifella sp. IM 167]|uniref:NAD(P)/FAD-dependent oxidoreductase n=1 Tax=Afifella sp. IM 167 TaxID=2033586 RepID=UPI001CCFF6EC|nr:FAD-binding oxidoreductase [Afifella sp. IM 167]MBZ8134654.1 D-amino-acid oxidase [Afifella sp. IM 167]
MPGPRVVPVHGDEDLPPKVDVVVIGGGIVGASTALELAEMGLAVALCEKGGIGHEQSSRNWGWVRITHRDPREIALMAEALRIWPTLQEKTGRDLGYRQTGILFAARDEKTFAEYDRWREHLTPFQIESRMVEGAELDALLPGHRMKLRGAAWTPIDGRAEPQKATPAIAEAARARGTKIFTECAVRGIETSAGRVSGVVTERGRIACDAVVLAGGAWSRLFAGNAGLDLPQLKVLSSVLRTDPIENGPIENGQLGNGPEPAIWCEDFGVRRRQDGGYTVAAGGRNVVDIVPDSFRLGLAFLPALASDWRALRFRLSPRFFEEASTPRRWPLDAPSPFEYRRVLDPKPADHADGALAALKQAFPALKDARVAQRWGGMIDVTPDAIPVISAVEQIPGFHIATGFSGHGFGIGPGAGRLMAEIVAGRPTSADPSDFRFSRFTDGSRVRPQTGF